MGKVYKPALRRRATQRALDERLVAARLASAASLRVAETPSGLDVRFTLIDCAHAGAVRALMKPFVLAYRLEFEVPR